QIPLHAVIISRSEVAADRGALVPAAGGWPAAGTIWMTSRAVARWLFPDQFQPDGLMCPQGGVAVYVGGGAGGVIVRALQRGHHGAGARVDDPADQRERGEDASGAPGSRDAGVADESGDAGDVCAREDLAAGVVGRPEVHQIAGSAQDVGSRWQVEG